MNDLHHHILVLETKLEELRTRGVFQLVPVRSKRSDGKGEWLEFKRRGAIIVDQNAPYRYRISLPLKRNEKKANKILEKVERTKQAEALILQINALRARLKERQKKVAEAAELVARANMLRQRAAFYTAQAAALQPT